MFTAWLHGLWDWQRPDKTRTEGFQGFLHQRLLSDKRCVPHGVNQVTTSGCQLTEAEHSKSYLSCASEPEKARTTGQSDMMRGLQPCRMLRVQYRYSVFLIVLCIFAVDHKKHMKSNTALDAVSVHC